MPNQDDQVASPPPFFTNAAIDDQPKPEFTPTPDNLSKTSSFSDQPNPPQVEHRESFHSNFPPPRESLRSYSSISPKKEIPNLSPTPKIPADLPHQPQSSSTSLAILLLAIISIASLAASSFLFLQNLTLKQQIRVLQSTESARQPSETGSTNPTLSDTPQGSPFTSNTGTSSATFSAFSDLGKVVSIAQKESSTAQLLMITSDDITRGEATVYKYWFRRTPSQKQYFHLQYSRTSEPQLFSESVVSPDNSIPDLIPAFQANQLGISDLDAHNLAWQQSVAPIVGSNLKPTQVKAKFINSRPSDPSITQSINLWQLTYIFPTVSNQRNITIQINANDQSKIFSNL